MIPEAAIPYSVGFATFIFGVSNGGPLYDAGATALLFGLSVFVIGRLFTALDSKKSKNTAEKIEIMYQYIITRELDCGREDCPTKEKLKKIISRVQQNDSTECNK